MTVACLLASGLLFFRGLPSLPGTVPISAQQKWDCPPPTRQQEPQYVTANIEDLRVGDTVLARDAETGGVVERRVVDAFSRTAYELRVLTICGPDGKDLPAIRTTDEHPFWVVEAEDFVPAGELEIGDHFVAPDGELTTLVATRSEPHPEGVTVYNFEVEGAHTYFVLPDSPTPDSPTLHGPPVLVHNAAGGVCGGAGGEPPNGPRNFSKKLKAEGWQKSRDAKGIARCEYCGKRLRQKPGSSNSYEADHRIPWAQGGSTTRENLAAACRRCNRSKGSKTLGDEWIPRSPPE